MSIVSAKFRTVIRLSFLLMTSDMLVPINCQTPGKNHIEKRESGELLKKFMTTQSLGQTENPVVIL